MPTFRQDNKLGDSVPLIKTPDIGDKQVTERKLADGSVTSSKLSTEIANMLSLLTTRISAFKVADSLSSLPTEENTTGWLVDNHLYVYVGNGLTPESGMYQDCGELRGPQGIQGEQGLSGLNGKSAYDIWTEQPGNEDKSEIDFLEFTRGSKGDKGDQGERGYDISNIEQLVKSTEDGGKNIIRVTRSDGWSKVFEILNGSKGSKGDKGTSIVKLEQTRKTTESSGLNTIEATLDDGTKESFEIYNGAKGELGDKGEKGDKGDQGEIGPQGNSGIADASNKTLVNDAITGGETDFLSAEVGKLGILTYDCSKGGTVTHATLQDAINSVPTTFQKVGLTITYKSGNTICRYTLKANTWSADPANWFSVEDKLSDLLSTIDKESELGVTQHFVKDDFTTKAEVKETNFFYHNDVVKLICTNKSSKDSWFSVGVFGTDYSESEIQHKLVKAGESLTIDRTEQYSGNGYWCKSIGNAKGKFEVYRIDPKVTKNTKDIANKFDKANVAQDSGESKDKVMSQKAVSDKLNKINNNGLKIILSKQADSGRLKFDYPYSKGTELSLVVTNLGSSEGYFTIGAIDTNGVDSEITTQKLEAGQSYTVNRKEIYTGKGYYCNSVNNKAFTYELIELNEAFRTLQAKVESSEIRPKVYVGPTRKYTKFTDGLSKAVELGNADLYVDAGIYDVVAELTISKIDSDSIAGYYGPKIGRGVRIYFSQGAKIVANYTGTLHDSLERFSPLNAIETTDIGGSDFEIHGGEFECTNTRYVVHDECNGKGSYKHLYENCRMILDNRNKTYFNQCQCIGGGLGEFADIQIIGGYYESKTIDISKPEKDQTISYHNPQPNFGSNFCNSVMIKDAYFKDGTIIVSQLGDSLKYSTFVVNNCSMTKAPYINGENDAGTGRFRMQSWNNDIRNS